MLHEQLVAQREHAPPSAPPTGGLTSDPHLADSAGDDGLGRVGPGSSWQRRPCVVLARVYLSGISDTSESDLADQNDHERVC